jgi:hypothetical protein
MPECHHAHMAARYCARCSMTIFFIERLQSIQLTIADRRGTLYDSGWQSSSIRPQITTPNRRAPILESKFSNNKLNGLMQADQTDFKSYPLS